MTTEERDGEKRESEEELLERASEELAQVHARIGPRFRRAEARTRARGFLRGLTSAGGTQEWLADGRGTGRTRSARSAAAVGRGRLG
jgi:hypothetical protein